MRTSRWALIVSVCACAFACGSPPAARCPVTPKADAPPAPSAPDEFTSLSCHAIDAAADAPPIVDCRRGGCELAYTATRMTTSPAGYEVGAPVAVETTADGWRLLEDGERLHVDIVDGRSDRAVTRIVIDGVLSGGFGSEGTAGNSYVGVAATPGASAPRMAAVSMAGQPHEPAVTRDELRVGVRCDVATDLQE